MLKVKILNRITKECKNKLDFETLEEAQAWIAENEKTSPCWGRYLPAREIPATESYNSLLKIEEFEKEIQAAYTETLYQRDEEGNLVLDQDGNAIPTGETVAHEAVFETWVRLHPEYEIEILDITEAYEAEQARIALIKQKKEEARAYLLSHRNNVGNLNVPELNQVVIKMLDLLEIL